MCIDKAMYKGTFTVCTCELSCSEESLNVVTIFKDSFLAPENPKENNMISAIIP